MEHEPSPDTIPLKALRTARSLSQNEVAEAIGTNANTVSRWERGIATPSPYYRRKLAEYFGVDPQALFSDLNDQIKKTTTVLLPKIEDESQGNLQTSPTQPKEPSRPLKITRRIYISIATSMIVILISGGISIFYLFLPKSSTNLFSPLCSSHFQSINTSIIPTPATSTSPDGEPIGLSEGATIFDLNRPNLQEVQDKLQAAQDWTNNPQNVVSSLKNALSIDQTDAEAQIYLENWQVLGSNHPHITFIVGVSLTPFFAGGARSTLQGAFLAQKECNDQNQDNNSQTQIVLMIANVGEDTSGRISNYSATFVADQIADQEHKDPTIVDIQGWTISAVTIDIQTELHRRGSKLPMMAACSSSDDLTRTYRFFRICPADAQQAPIAVNFVLNKMRKKRISIVYDETTSFANSLHRDFFNNISKVKGNIVGQESYTESSQSAIQTALTNVLSKNPDAIFFAGYASDLVTLLTLLNATPQANKLLIIGPNALAITNSYTNPLPDMRNVYFTAFASPNEWDHISPKPPFFQEYKDKFGTLTAPTGLPSIDPSVMLSYDGMSALLYASQQALSKHHNTITPSYLEDELKQITVTYPLQGITGRIAFNSNGNQDPSKMIFVEHIDGHNLVIDEQHGCLLKDNCSS